MDTRGLTERESSSFADELLKKVNECSNEENKMGGIALDAKQLANFNYDNPIKITVQKANTIIEEGIKDEIFKIVTKYDIDVDEEKIVQILQQDPVRYKAAWADGYSAGCRDTGNKLDKIQDILNS